MRSGIMLCSAPCKSSTPSISIFSVPAPLIFAPILLRSLAKSSISGSHAALFIVVFPFANAAAIITFSVPVTLTFSKKVSAPTSRPFGARATTFPASSETFAPSCSNAFKCKSIGRVPIAQPPGSETFA